MERNDHVVQVGELRQAVAEFVRSRGFEEYHDPKCLSMSIAIEAAELMEIFQWVSVKESWEIAKGKELVHLKEELADVLIYSLSLANQVGIDVSQAIIDKLEKNSLRYPRVEEE